MPYLLRLCLIICLVGGSSLASAQNDVSPFYFTANGILYEWYPGESEPEPLTDEGYIHSLVQAPTGNRIAFVWHDIANREDYLNYGYAYREDFRGDQLRILENGEIRTRNPSITTVNPSAPYPVIEGPTWSADGERFAWVQGIIVEDERTGYQSFGEAVLRFFELQDNQTYGPELFQDGYYISGGDAGENALANPHWVTHHIATFYPFAGPEIAMRLDNTAVHHEANRLLITNVVYAGGIDVVDVTTEKGQYIGVFYEQYGQWDLINPLSFESEALTDDALIEAYSPNAPETSMSWRYNAARDVWQLHDPTETVQASIPAPFWRKPFALSPDGDAAAYIEADTLYVIWSDGQQEHIMLDGLYSLAWGAVQWRVANNVSMPNVDQPYILSESNCPQDGISIGVEGTLETSYYVELYAHIEPLRYVMNELPPGIPISIIGGPRCHDRGEAGIDTWWQIETYDQIGWVLADHIEVSEVE